MLKHRENHFEKNGKEHFQQKILFCIFLSKTLQNHIHKSVKKTMYYIFLETEEVPYF